MTPPVWTAIVMVCLATGPARADRICDGVVLGASTRAECLQQAQDMRTALAGSRWWVVWQECQITERVRR